MPNRKRHVLVLSEQVLFRAALVAALRGEGLHVVEQSTAAPLRNKRHHDVVLVDLEHASVDCCTLVDDLRDQLPGAFLVLLGSPARLAASVDGHGDAEIEIGRTALATLVAAVATGRVPHRSSELARAHRLWRQITPRQREVLRWLAHGLDNPAIGGKLRVGVRAVKAHVSALLALFGLESRTQLALIARDAGMRPG